MTLFNPISMSRRLGPRSLLRRGRASAETIVRENIPHVAIPHVTVPHVAIPRVTVAVERAPRRRGASMFIILGLLTLAAAVIVYLIWQRRDREPAELVTEPERPDATPTSPSEPGASPSETPDEPVAEPSDATSFTPPAVADDDNGDGASEDEPEPETAPPAREPVTARAAVAPAAAAPLSSPRADDSVARRVERRLHLPGATAIAMPGGGINLPASRPGTPPRA